MPDMRLLIRNQGLGVLVYSYEDTYAALWCAAGTTEALDPLLTMEGLEGHTRTRAIINDTTSCK